MLEQITLRGLVLPVGGVRDKVLAAHRGGIRRVLLPVRNRGDLEELPSDVAQDLEFTFVERIADVIFALFPSMPGEGEEASATGAAAGDEAAGRGRAEFHPGHGGHESVGAVSGASVGSSTVSTAGQGRGRGHWVRGGQVRYGEDVAGELLESFL